MIERKNGRYNILFTTSFSNMTGGGQWSLYYLIKYLDKERFHPFVLCPEEGELSVKLRPLGVDMIFYRLSRMRYINPFNLITLTGIIRRLKIDIVHTDSTNETFYAGIAARLTGTPLVWHVRVAEGWRRLDRALNLLSSRLVFVSNAVYSRFPWFKGSAKAGVVYNGIDLDDFDSHAPSQCIKGKGREGVLIACIGRIEDSKGQKRLVSAMKDIDNARLVLIGDGEDGYVRGLEDMIRDMGLSGRVINLGSRKDVPSLIKELDILVCPTLSEGFSRVILEAMAAGKPVVATDAGGNPEAVEDGVTGYIVPLDDTGVLVERINELVSSKQKREEMGMAGRKRVEKYFTIKKNAESIERVYIEILSAR